MARNKPSIAMTIRRFRNELEAMNIHCDKILIFGSYAHNRASEGSDIDLVVISDDWKTYSTRERLEILGVAAARILAPVQAVGFTAQEIKNKTMLPFWQDIVEHARKAA